MSGRRELTGTELVSLLTGFEQHMFRLELLQHYVVDGNRPLRAWLAGDPFPPGADRLETLDVLRELTTTGRRAGRVHLVQVPLSEYVRYELEQYEANAQAGEDIRIAVADDRNPALAALARDGQDFVLLDPDGSRPAVIWYEYDHTGRLLRWVLDETPTALERCRHWQATAVAHSVPLVAFTAARTDHEDQGR